MAKSPADYGSAPEGYCGLRWTAKISPTGCGSVNDHCAQSTALSRMTTLIRSASGSGAPFEYSGTTLTVGQAVRSTD